MPSEIAERFMRTLREAETSGDVGPLVDLFAEDAELSNLAHDGPHRGRDGARRFWSDYLEAFQEVRSTFHHVLDTDRGAAMEWVSEGTRPGGEPLRYRGISVIEVRDGLVHRFRTYYDSAAFLAPGAGVEAHSTPSAAGT